MQAIMDTTVTFAPNQVGNRNQNVPKIIGDKILNQITIEEISKDKVDITMDDKEIKL